MSARVDFWFEFASTYSYLAVARIDAEAEARGVEVAWRPLLLGPIFAAQGLNTSPFVLNPAKGRYMWRDLERRSAAYGLSFRRPTDDDRRVFPQHSVFAARMALVGLDAAWGEDFCRGVYQAQFADGRDISDKAVVIDVAMRAGAPQDAPERAVSEANKARLRANVDEAMALGVFGAPSVTVRTELFWGDDRLNHALDWAARG
ncbi:MAG: 2-hydroxychromene-2-carboxylate isomerase [Caulobacterales bacterium]|nr:2-hydroxychromene-2-carboxylate isomerase [Caulobacterales bacterium]